MGQNVDDLCWAQNRPIDVAVHIGTLLAVLLYFRRDVLSMAGSVLSFRYGGQKLPAQIVFASLPVLAVGFAVESMKPSWVCWLELMAWMTLIFGILLWVADRFYPAQKNLNSLSWKGAACIGIAQVLALAPGVSRSGITMTAGRFLGLSRPESARFSLFLAIIAIVGAGTLSALDMLQNDTLELGPDALLAAGLSFITGWISIAVMMKWLEKATFLPFVIYRVFLGILLLVLIYSGAVG